MNFDDFQSAWKEDTGKDIEIPASVAILKHAAGPVNSLRKTIRHEGIGQIIALLFMGVIPCFVKINPILILPYYAIYAITLAVSAFYLVRFYRFYKRLNSNTLSTKVHLYELYYDLKLNLEIYRSFNYFLLPFMLMFAGIITSSTKKMNAWLLQPGAITQHKILLFLAVFIFAMAFILVLVEVWISYYYGKYLKPVEKIIKEFDEE